MHQQDAKAQLVVQASRQRAPPAVQQQGAPVQELGFEQLSPSRELEGLGSAADVLLAPQLLDEQGRQVEGRYSDLEQVRALGGAGLGAGLGGLRGPGGGGVGGWGC